MVLAMSPVSTVHAEPSDAEVAAGVAAALVGGVLVGKSYKNYKKKKQIKKLNKKEKRNLNQAKQDFSTDGNKAIAKWKPKCQAAQRRYGNPKCNWNNPSLTCRKLRAECPI